SGTHFYNSGSPINIVNANNFNTFSSRQNALYMDQVQNGYLGWVAERENPNWLGDDRFFVDASHFGVQDADALGRTRPGDATRFNKHARTQWNLSENYSLAKSFDFTEDFRLDFRFEAFNAFNRARFNTGST